MNEFYYVKFLKQYLERKCSQNSNYSLRACARDLAIAPSTLSEVLNRKRVLTESVASTIINHLPMDEQQVSLFMESVKEANKLHKLLKTYKINFNDQGIQSSLEGEKGAIELSINPKHRDLIAHVLGEICRSINMTLDGNEAEKQPVNIKLNEINQ